MMEFLMADSFESRFFEQLRDWQQEVRSDMRKLSSKVDNNTTLTQSISKRVDKLDGKVFKKRDSPVSGLFQDKQIVLAFAFALLVFLLILASVLHVKVPAVL